MKTLADLLAGIQEDFHPVVPFNPGRDRLVAFDLSRSNTTLTAGCFNDPVAFNRYIQDRLKEGQARYGIGGYNEWRDIYSMSPVFDDANGDEPRRLHLGVDVWGAPNTAVMTPLDAIVHSVGYHDRKGDYGGTIILSHQVDDTSFHTLYGHLSLNSVRDLRGGERLARGDIFAEFGIPSENGQWPPHLHFQVINDLQGWSGDYPGVCKLSEKDIYLQNCPDPELILQLKRYL